MENATKALLLAGGMLLAIMALSLFVYMFNSLRGNATNIYANIEQAKITEFNQQFFNIQYSGERTINGEKIGISMQDAISLAHLAIDNNSTQKMPVTIVVTLNVNGNKYELEKMSEENLKGLLQDYFDRRFKTCNIDYADNTDIVGKIEISE